MGSHTIKQLPSFSLFYFVVHFFIMLVSGVLKNITIRHSYSSRSDSPPSKSTLSDVVYSCYNHLLSLENSEFGFKVDSKRKILITSSKPLKEAEHSSNKPRLYLIPCWVCPINDIIILCRRFSVYKGSTCHLCTWQFLHRQVVFKIMLRCPKAK